MHTGQSAFDVATAGPKIVVPREYDPAISSSLPGGSGNSGASGASGASGMGGVSGASGAVLSATLGPVLRKRVDAAGNVEGIWGIIGNSLMASIGSVVAVSAGPASSGFRANAAEIVSRTVF